MINESDTAVVYLVPLIRVMPVVVPDFWARSAFVCTRHLVQLAARATNKI